jgi:hypothetical protein
MTISGAGAATFSSSVTAVQASIGYTTAAPTNGMIVNGNVGIGTDSPNAKFQVGPDNNPSRAPGEAVSAFSSSTGTETVISFGQGATNGNTGVTLSFNPNRGAIAANSGWYQRIDGATADGFMSFGQIIRGTPPTLTERMRITSGGNILFGTQTLSTTHAYFDNAGSDRMVLNLGSSTTSNANLIAFNNPNGNVGTIATNGSSTLYNTTSDYRLKEDLQEIVGLEKVLALKVYDYKWKSDESRMDGVLAHELAEVLPYAVSGEKDELNEDGTDKMQSVDYSKIVPILIKAIQEQQEQIDSLKNQIK